MSHKGNVIQRNETNKRRRVLSDIANTNNTLGFDMANISHVNRIDLQKGRKSDTSIPLPPREKSREINLLTLRRNENSRIPTKVDSYIAMNRLLTQKSRMRLPSFQATYEKDRLEEQEHMEHHINLLKGELKSADRRLHQTTKELTILLDTNDVSQNTNKMLQKRRAELRERTLAAQKQFDTLEMRVNANVAHEEKIMHLKLRELENSLKDEYNDAKFQLEVQVKETEFHDAELEEQAEKLRKEKEELKKKLEKTIQEKNETLLVEQAAMDAEKERILMEKKKQVESATAAYHTKKGLFETVMREYQDLLSKTDKHKEAIGDLNRQIQEIERNLHTFDSQRLQKEQEIHQLEIELQDSQHNDLDWEKKVNDAQRGYEAIRQKHQQYEETRRILEHAIMSFSTRGRLLVRLDQDFTDNQNLNDNQAVVGGRHYSIDKVMKMTDNYVREWSLLVNEVNSKSDVSVVFSGSVRHPSTYLLVDTFADMSKTQKQVQYTLQSVLLDSTTTDLLNKCTETEISVLNKSLLVISQRMRVESISDLTTAVKNVKCDGQAVCHMLTAETTHGGKAMSHRLFMMNLTNMSIEKQTDLLRGNGNGDIATILAYIGENTKMVHACDVDGSTNGLLDAAVSFYR